jgi:hypothetical protein
MGMSLETLNRFGGSAEQRSGLLSRPYVGAQAKPLLRRLRRQIEAWLSRLVSGYGVSVIRIVSVNWVHLSEKPAACDTREFGEPSRPSETQGLFTLLASDIAKAGCPAAGALL